MQPYPLITIVGGSGFVGRHTVKLLAEQGYRLRILVRDTIAAEFLKTSATVGQIAIEHVDITRPETLAGKFVGSDAVVSLVSILYPSGRQKFNAINVAGAKAVAEEAARAGVSALVHISALGVEQSAATTAYGRTKLAGEKAVREAFPTATILRPSLIVGPEDGFFQRFGRMSILSPALPLIGCGKNLFQPVLVTDIARAIAMSITNTAARGKTLELAGPQPYSMRGLLKLMLSITNRRRWLVPIPFWMAKLKALGFEIFSKFSPFAPLLTRDQVKLLAYDNIATPGAPGFAALGLVPESIETPLPGLLARYVKD